MDDYSIYEIEEINLERYLHIALAHLNLAEEISTNIQIDPDRSYAHSIELLLYCSIEQLLKFLYASDKLISYQKENKHLSLNDLHNSIGNSMAKSSHDISRLLEDIKKEGTSETVELSLRKEKVEISIEDSEHSDFYYKTVFRDKCFDLKIASRRDIQVTQ